MVDINESNIDLEDINKQTNTDISLDFSNDVYKQEPQQFQDKEFEIEGDFEVDIEDIEEEDSKFLDRADFIDLYGYTKEEKLASDIYMNLEIEKEKEKVREMGEVVRWGDLALQNNFAFMTVREVDNLIDMNKINTKIDDDFVNQDLFALIKEYGFNNPEYEYELLNHYMNNESMFRTRAAQLKEMDDSTQRSKLDIEGDFIKTLGTYVLDPLMLAAEIKIIASVGHLAKARNFSKLQAFGAHSSSSAVLYGTEEYLKNEINRESDSTEVMMGALFGGLINGGIGYFTRRSEMLQQVEIRDKANRVFDEIDESYMKELDNVSDVVKKHDNEIKKILKTDEIPNDPIKFLKKQSDEIIIKKETFKSKVFKKLENNKVFIKINKNIETLSKKVDEICN